MTYTPISGAGNKLYISATPTGSPTLEVLGVQDLDRVGKQSQKQDRTTMRDTAMVKGKAALSDSGQIKLKGLWSNKDAGQQMLKTAAASAAAYNFKFELNDASAIGLTTNTMYTFSALVLGYDTVPGGASGKDLTFSVTLEISGDVTETAAA